MPQIVVFLGPSLRRDRAQSILDAIYLPPAGQSDLLSAVAIYRPDAIGLIDGVFLERPAVWHKEILYALNQGIAVYGASSMGALRAAETAAFGMIGVGEIYQRYASGELIDDDEVALVYGPGETGYQPLSEPMVNVRATLQLAWKAGIISEPLYHQLIAIAKSIYFPDRTFASIFEQAVTMQLLTSEQTPLQAFVREHYVDLKQQDALLLLQTLGDRFPAGSASAPATPAATPGNFELGQTHVYTTLFECERQVQRQGVAIPLRRIAECVALHAADFDDLNFHSLNRLLAQILATLLKIEVESPEIEQEQQRFRTKYQLQRDSDFKQWLQDNDMAAPEFQALMQELAVCRRLHRWLLNRQAYQRNVKGLLNELRLRNAYPAWADAVASQEQLLQEHAVELKDLRYHNQNLKHLLQDHLRETDCTIPPISLPDWLLETGFLNLACLQFELVRARTAREILSEPAP